MEKIDKNNRSILIPVFDICSLPPMDKVVALANKSKMKIHIAGFISSSSGPQKMLEQTIRLTRILRVMLHRLKGKVTSVSSKIYTGNKRNKVLKLVEEEQVKVIVSQKIDQKLIDLTECEKIMLLQLVKSKSKKDKDSVVMCDGKMGNLKEVKEIMAFFGSKINFIQDNALKTDQHKLHVSSLQEPVTIHDIKDIIKMKKMECIALKKEMLKLNKQSQELLNQNDASVLLY